MKKISKPRDTEYALYYENYVKLVPAEPSVLDQLKASAKEVTALYKSLDTASLLTPYEPGKWSLRDLLMHLIDVERVFVYRAMRFARLDRTPLPFFDENEFAKQAQADKIPLSKLLKEYNANRNLTIAFFNNLTAKQVERAGIASQYTMSVRACAWIIAGHELHHRHIIATRYLSGHKNQ
ncbi:DNA damage-inducible protein DinB [Taibaiella sp. KBW10]|uniref:DinB family protein n=1 Tax=Taibaiella sp. KBW10 TaxID=2153357 RepID=UPI000F5AF61B|nr:DinB family protein [Taibaiella sp. KBW10]RQO30863.1 DNA damage-inducible protein DinB [Taibaiella sp. KBW10]